MWPSATKWGSLRGLSKSRMIIHCNKHNYLHILMQKWLFYDIPIKSYSMLNMIMHDIIETNFIEIWAQKDCNLCITLWASQKANVPETPFLPYFHWKRCLLWLCLVWWIFRKNTSKLKNFDLGSGLCSFLKINFTANTSFSHAETHLNRDRYIVKNCKWTNV